MSVSAIVGANWGDEGKGKMTDVLARDSDFVIRFQGGNNAGHTIINEYGKFALHLLPSGVFYPHTTNILGTGIALNIPAFIEEVDELVARGVPKPNLCISERAQVLLPYHLLMDVYEEERLGDRKYGSTKSGIAPFYSDKYLKVGVQVADLYDEGRLRDRVARALEVKNVLFEHLYHKPLMSLEEVVPDLMAAGEQIEPYVCDTSLLLHNALKENKKILVEGQLGALRDPDHGIYPYPTSSSTLAGFASIGAGIPPHSITQVVAVAKAYSSCVGAGPFISEILARRRMSFASGAAMQGSTVRRRGGPAGWAGSMLLLRAMGVACKGRRRLRCRCSMCWVIWMRFRFVQLMRSMGRRQRFFRFHLCWIGRRLCWKSCRDGEQIFHRCASSRICQQMHSVM